MTAKVSALPLAQSPRSFALSRPRKAPAAPAGASLLRRIFCRREPTTYQKCLAVHMHFAAPHRTLD